MMHNFLKFRRLIFLIFPLFLFTGCKKNAYNTVEIYNNNFENSDLSNISGGIVNDYNNSKVIGYYNNGGFKLLVNNISSHDLVTISFDLYIHDTWSGNNRGNAVVIDGPDIWQMKLDGEPYINTTFSNTGDCGGGVYCLQQSYPNNYPFHNDPKTGAYNKNLPGVCALKGLNGGTSLYKIEKTIKHRKGSLLVEFKDMLKQSNTNDPLCDESWSLDNLIIKTSNLK